MVQPSNPPGSESTYGWDAYPSPDENVSWITGKPRKLLSVEIPPGLPAPEDGVHAAAPRAHSSDILQAEHWVDDVLESPVFWGVLTLIALAIGFSPRASTSAAWVCLAAGWLLLTRMVYMLDHVRAKARIERLKILGIVSLCSLVALAAFGFWLMQPLKSAIAAGISPEPTPTPSLSQATPTPLL